jgi:hypothetical protein
MTRGQFRNIEVQSLGGLGGHWGRCEVEERLNSLSIAALYMAVVSTTQPCHIPKLKSPSPLCPPVRHLDCNIKMDPSVKGVQG